MATYEKTDETNWLRVCKLLIEVGREIFLDIFQTAAQPLTLRQLLLNNKSDIIQQRKDQTLVLNKKQFRLLYYENKKTINKLDLESEYREKKIAKWDISLISVLLNYCSENGILTISDPVHDSHNKIRKLRNVLYAHIGENGCKMTDSEFEIQWHEVVKFLTESAPFNIQDKISSVQKEEIVDGDKLKEIFKNWMQRDIEIIDRLDKIEKTSKKLHAETHQKLAEMTQFLKNQGAEATDRVPRKMHKGEERLSSQVSMDAEPDEAAGGESVLADRFLELTVNEPGESRAESASRLQLNLLTEQRDTEMPPEIGYIDCLILYAEVDRAEAVKFKEHLIKDIKIKKHGPVVALLYDDPELRSLSEGKFHYLQVVCERSTYIMLYMTNAFVEDKCEECKRDACLMQSIEKPEKRWSVLPVYPQKKDKINVPIVINTLIGYNYFNNDEHYRKSMAKRIEDRVDVRVKGNERLGIEKQQQRRDDEIIDSHPQQDTFVQTCGQTPGASAEIQTATTILEDTTDDVDLPSSSHDEKMEQMEENKKLDIEKQQQRTDKEIIDSHPQQDAFVQICGQTPGASAKSQEANTIPDLEVDTLDDVDLPSSCHDDKMEQKEEAQVASLAEIKQKKKKKKKKKTRR